MGNCLRLGISRIGLAWTKRRMKTSNKRNAISLLILGTQAVGKTTIALRLWKFKRSLPDLNYVQTKGFNTYAIRRKNKSTINLYDLGGHPSIQELWDHYYADAHGIIFVVDVSNPESLSETAIVFSKVVSDERIRGKPILLLANKQDLGGASEVELDSVMNLQEVVNAARCLTRLDESAATDLKNDKGIFDGFRWLVSHITNHYHELNDRVMHDILEEKNREKARRAAIKEQLELSSPQLPPPSNNHCHQDRPSSQKSLVSKTFVRDESAVDLQTQGHMNDSESLSPPGASLGLKRGSKPKRGPVSKPTQLPPPLTNYLIKSRPNSSLGESHNNPFLLPRNSTNAALSNKRRSLPTLQPLSGKSNANAHMNRFFTNINANANGGEIVQRGPGGGIDPFVVAPKISDSQEIPTFTSNPIPSSFVMGRLSPEGANSESGDSLDERKSKHGFVDETEKNFETKSDHQQENIMMNICPVDAQNIPKMPSVTDVSPIGSVNDVASPEKVKKLIRTESSDTERAGEILMVTTLAQVHQDHISNGRRGSSTSTHDSIALSLSSFKSEETNVTEGGFNKDPGLETDPQSQSRSQSALNMNMNRGIPSQTQFQSGGAKLFEDVLNTSSNMGRNWPRTEKEKEVKPDMMRVGIGKNKTNPLPPGMVMATTPTATTYSGHTSGTRLPKVTTTPQSASGRNPAVSLSGRRSRENVFIVGPQPSAPGGGKNKLQNRNLSGFSQSLENSSSSSKSQFTRSRPPPMPPMPGGRTGLPPQETGD